MPDQLRIRKAIPSDIKVLRAFIFEHGVNEWNFLPKDGVTAHLNAIATGEVQGLLAEKQSKLAGYVTFYRSTKMSRYQPAAEAGTPHGYIAEAVVHRDYTGQGIGTLLMKSTVEDLWGQGFAEIYVERHEENRSSAGIMRKAGFVEIDLFHDPERRSYGSRRTSVSRLRRTG